MPPSDRYAALFEPVSIGPKTAPNRFWQTPHASGFGTDLPRNQRAYREAKAAGGWGVVFTEATSLAPEADKSPAPLARLWDDGDTQNLRHVVEGIHAHGSLAGVELEYHSSIGFMTETRGLHMRSVVPLAGDSSLPVAYAGTAAPIRLEDIEELQQMHVDAALRAVDAGFDLITFHCGHAASLFAHFLIPYYNTRTDEYGGSFENRCRFTRETMSKVRTAVGDRAAVGMRFGVDTLDSVVGLAERGLHADGEAPLFIEHLDDLVDYWDLVIGGYDWGQDAQSSRTASENHEARYVGQMKKHTDKPVVNVGRFNSPDTMVKVIRSGQCDFIGAARASISDPFLPQKIREGRIDDIRECIGCNICVSRDMGTARIICTQNPTIGEEYRRGWHAESVPEATNRDLNVLVLGAGPAGMECALTLGRRGFANVHLVDSAAEIGGSLNWITKLPGRVEWRHIIEYREYQMSRMKNVEVIVNQTMTVDEVIEYGAEIVVVATGSHYALDQPSPFGRNYLTELDVYAGSVHTPEQVVEGAELGPRVTILDLDGYFVGPGLAELLSGKGHEVTVLTPAETLGTFLKYTKEQTRMLDDLRRLGVVVYPSTRLTAASGKTLTATTPHGERAIAADSVIIVGQRVSDSAVYEGLIARRDEWTENGLQQVHQIGDCVRPHFMAEAIFTGHRLAREIDSPDPAKPLPFLRERPLVLGSAHTPDTLPDWVAGRV